MEKFRGNISSACGITFWKHYKKKKVWYSKTMIPKSIADKLENKYWEFIGLLTYMQPPSQKCIFIKNYLKFVKEFPGFTNVRMYDI